MDNVEITPRFHIIGSSKNNLIVIEKKHKKKKLTSENVSKFKSRTHSKHKNKNPKSSKTFKNADNKIESILFNKKFLLRNDFDRKHCKKFLKEKLLMLEKPILYDEICN